MGTKFEVDNSGNLTVTGNTTLKTTLTGVLHAASGVTSVATVTVGEGGTGATSLTGYVIGNGGAAMTASSAIPNTSVTGLGTMSTQNSGTVSISGGTIAGITDLTVSDGGTGASTLTGYVKGAGTTALTASATIPNTDISGLGTMSTQASSNVSITGGAISGITDLAIADGGTGQSTAQAAINALTAVSGTTAGYVLTKVGTDAAWAAAAGGGAGPTWVKVNKTYSDLSAAATTNDIEVYSLPLGGVIHGIKIKASQAFNIAGYTLSVGIVGNLTRYASAFDVNQAVGNMVFQMSQDFFCENQALATSVRLAATANSNLNGASLGIVDVWLLVSSAV